MMDEFEHIIAELINNDFVAECFDETMYRANGCATEIILSKLHEDEDYFTDAMVAVKKLDKAAAMLLIQGNIMGVYAECISEQAEEILEYYGIEFEYNETVPEIHEGKCTALDGKQLSYEEMVSKTDDPLEALEILEQYGRI